MEKPKSIQELKVFFEKFKNKYQGNRQLSKYEKEDFHSTVEAIKEFFSMPEKWQENNFEFHRPSPLLVIVCDFRRIKEFKDEQKEKKRSVYLKYKKLACKNANSILQENRNIFDKLQEIAVKDGLIELSVIYGHGDDNQGYYRYHLMLNLKNLQTLFPNDILYIVECFVPSPDNGYDWKITEFHELQKINFSPAFEMIGKLASFSKKENLIIEMERVIKRGYSTCVGEDRKDTDNLYPEFFDEVNESFPIK